jgi:hypothetical protein
VVRALTHRLQNFDSLTDNELHNLMASTARGLILVSLSQESCKVIATYILCRYKGEVKAWLNPHLHYYISCYISVFSFQLFLFILLTVDLTVKSEHTLETLYSLSDVKLMRLSKKCVSIMAECLDVVKIFSQVLFY